MHMIPTPDAVYLLSVCAATFATQVLAPKKYKPIAWMLLAECCVFIGFVMLMKHLVLYDGLWFDIFMGVAQVPFIIAFLLVGSRYLSVISAMIGITFLYGYADFIVMICFQILQLSGLSEGLYYGLFKRERRPVIDSRRDDSNYHLINR